MAICKMSATAREWSRLISRLKSHILRPALTRLVQAVALMVLAVAPIARAQMPSAPPTSSATGPAERVYRNGVIFTSNAQNEMAEAVAIRDGRIVYVGSNRGVAPFVGVATVTVDLKNRFLMPGLIDGHMHPLEAGMQLLKCSLNYESLTTVEMQQRIQACLDHAPPADANAWLEVVSWF